MKLHVAGKATAPYNDGPRTTGLQLYQQWLQLARRICDDPGIPEDKRLHAMILLEGVQMMERKRPKRGDRPAPASAPLEVVNARR